MGWSHRLSSLKTVFSFQYQYYSQEQKNTLADYFGARKQRKFIWILGAHHLGLGNCRLLINVIEIIAVYTQFISNILFQQFKLNCFNDFTQLFGTTIDLHPSLDTDILNEPSFS